MTFSDKPEQILLGSLLGDGCITTKNSKKFTYREMHSIKQEDYLLWKNKYLNFNFYRHEFLGKTRVEIRKENKNFKKYYDLFYINGKKAVNRRSLDTLNEIGLAYWYLDDGHYPYRTDCIVLSTQTFGLKGNKIIQKYFKERWDIDCKVQKRHDERYDKRRYNLCINAKETKRFIELIKTHVLEIPSMYYKIGLDNHKIEEAGIKNRKYYLDNRDKIKEYYLDHKKEKLKYRRDYYKKFGR